MISLGLANKKSPDFEYVILDKERDSTWQPTQDDISKAELHLRNYLKLKSIFNKAYKNILAKITAYKRQYYGITDTAGNQILYINCLTDSGTDWKHGLVIVKDGGDDYFQAKINRKTGRIVSLNINGQA